VKTTLIAAHQVTKGDLLPLYGCLGVLALAASVKRAGYQCDVLDLVEYNNLADQPLDQVTDEIVKKIIQSNPNILGISTTSDSLAIGLELGRKIKKLNPDLILIFGGPGVSYCSQEVLKHFYYVDYILRGEADDAFPEFISAIISRNFTPEVKGLLFRNESGIEDLGWPEPIADLDSLPIPAYEFCQNHSGENIWFDRHFGFIIEAGRGCPYNCIFCSTASYFKRKYRLKSVKRLMEEIKYVKHLTRDKIIRFNHDLLTYNHEYIESLCHELIKHYPELKWSCFSRIDTVNHELLHKMARAGCVEIYYGIEVATEKMQKLIGKRLKLANIDEILESMRKLNLNFVFSFVIGLPGEEISDIQALISLALKSKSICQKNCLVQIHTLVPDSGARLLRENHVELEYDEEGSIIDSSISREWFSIRKLIQTYPEIFPRFYNLRKVGHEKNELKDPTTYANFAFILEEVIPYSLVFAYRYLNEKLAKVVLECLHQEHVILLNNLEDSDYNNLLDKLRISITDLISGSDELKFFQSVFEYEKTIFQVTQKKSSDFYKKIEIDYSESEIIDYFSNSNFPSDNQFKQKKHLIVGWDGTNQKIKCFEIPHELLILV
jgi:radical SAM superfamily enzyme YgiQ (UPF0313 family)